MTKQTKLQLIKGTMSSRLTLELGGEAKLLERTDKSEHDHWNTIELLDDVVLEKAELEVSAADEVAGVCIEIADYHVAASSKDGARVFHMRLAVDLRWEEVVRLHRYLGFLLADRDS